MGETSFDEGLHLLGTSGQSLELNLSLRFRGAERAGVVLALAEDKSEGLYLLYDRTRGVLCLEPRSPYREEGIWSKPYEYPLELTGDSLSLHVFLDGSTAEVFARGVGLTARFYPRAECRRVALCTDGSVVLEGLEAWNLKNIWGRR